MSEGGVPPYRTDWRTGVNPVDEGGDPACWLSLVCEVCGRVRERPHVGACEHCGALPGGAVDAGVGSGGQGPGDGHDSASRTGDSAREAPGRAGP
ncbi:hypothetical protein [Streptomyces sp. NPDC047108]|uniref:hypothetical protein n=1 Tax=Streptomyces sp. NPDC047108 TaxID=3155025 RepID=UPI00340A6CE1